MQSHNLKRTHKNKKARQIGRAGQRGKTSGRGTKGQNARAGHKKRPEIRDFIKRVPKLRGRGKNLNTSIQGKPTVVNLENLEKLFKDGDIINPETLIKAGLINKISGAALKVKILSKGTISKKLIFKGCEFSKTAKEAVEKAGGSIM
jgi:large subunit ribosomal protein L15